MWKHTLSHTHTYTHLLLCKRPVLLNWETKGSSWGKPAAGLQSWGRLRKEGGAQVVKVSGWFV